MFTYIAGCYVYPNVEEVSAEMIKETIIIYYINPHGSDKLSCIQSRPSVAANMHLGFYV